MKIVSPSFSYFYNADSRAVHRALQPFIATPANDPSVAGGVVEHGGQQRHRSTLRIVHRHHPTVVSVNNGVSPLRIK